VPKQRSRLSLLCNYRLFYYNIPTTLLLRQSGSLDFGFGEPQITKLPPILVTYVIGEIDAVRGGAAV
jgi:hypothetical protein